jgi:Tfp pilus assembly protein PilN
MRPVNLIPVEERHDSQSPLRTGPLPYVLVGALALAVLGVSTLVLTGNQIAERKDEVTTLKREDAVAQAHAQRLAAYVQFAEMREQRLATVAGLADSRFDWERVMRELSKILPSDVWLTNLEASAGGGGSEGAASGVAGPSLQISGCANGEEGVAGFITALKEIDGVTRVGVETSTVESAEGEGGGGSGGCGPGRAQFQMIVAFDAAPVPLDEAEEAEAATTEAASESTESETTTTSTEG